MKRLAGGLHNTGSRADGAARSEEMLISGMVTGFVIFGLFLAMLGQAPKPR
jgi:hypothetical protein